MKKLIFVFAFLAFACNSDDDNSPNILGCTDPSSFNYDANANTDDGSCIPVLLGCTDPSSFNYDANANTDDGSCIPVLLGCTDPTSINYDANANTDDGSCIDETTYSLIGTWSGTVTDTEDNSQGQLTLVLNSNATGSIDVVWSEDDIFSDNFTWTSNDTQIITVSDTDNEGDEVLNYSFVDQNTLEISSTDDDDDSSTLTRQ